MTAEENYRLLQEIDANRRFILMAYLQNPKLLKKADALQYGNNVDSKMNVANSDATHECNYYMRKQVVIKTLESHRDTLHSHYDVGSISIFGSVARDEASSESDVDLLVTFIRSPGMFQFLQLKEFLENILSCRVDLVTKNALKKQLSERILKEAIRVT